MSSDTPDTDLWLERSRLDGMLLGAVSYGMFFLLTIQATIALTRRPRSGSKIAEHRWMLLSYVFITFILGTIGFAGNAKYTEMIWIDLRNAPGGPAALINNELNYWINMMALSCYYIMEWFMQALLLHRCFIIWGWEKYVVWPMTTLFLAMIAMSILILAESSGAVFYNINTQLAYLCIEVGMTVIYTVLVTGRLFALRKQMKEILGREHVRTYETVAAMVIESAAMYSTLGIIFIIAFAVHSNVSNLVFLAISHVQGIAQLLIIIRVAQGRAFTQDWTSTSVAPTTSLTFGSTKNFTDIDLGPESSNGLNGTTDAEINSGPVWKDSVKSTAPSTREQRSELVGDADL
ncbi:hypothetical protein HYDPIDRAFT_28853 [Hydnomerulius pinastri MD-312]|uniref:Uncharacterized protein n=1 Tax=Hydnomerulius pinastri MD-312 TaxID=994086 RepID=A0A0C9VZR7_9AGAM|nr:hypothetical protein HYDPIDRAFT_28853 [Hydnomerulius pinastri MD-312]